MTQMMSWLGFGPSDLRAPLVGRTAEMHALDDALEQALATREPRIVTLLGAAGVGKSRLVHDLLARIRTNRELGLRTYRGSARDVHESYGIFARLLRARFGLVEGMDEEAAKAQVRAHIATVLEDRKVGDVAYFLGQFLDLQFPDSPLTKAVSDDPREAALVRRSVFRSFLEADAARGPMCMVFEDLHEAHDESIELLHFLLDNLSGPVLAVCVARNELMTRNESWRSVAGARHTVVELGPLSEPEAASMMQALLAPCGDPPQQLIDAACQLAGGNPQLLEQMVRIFHDTGVLEEEDALAETPSWLVHLEKLDTVRLPLTVDDAVQARVAALTTAERQLLERAAAIGSVFWLGALLVLERMDSPPPEYWAHAESEDVRHLRERLNGLVERDYLLRLPDSTFPGEEEYVFKQNLERERIAKLTSPSMARRYHEAVAEWLEHQSDVRSHEEYLAMLAGHRERAGAQSHAAITYLEAGDVARSRYANSKALEHYRKGLELLGAAEPSRRIDALHHYSDVLYQAGQVEEALGALREMLSLAWRLNLANKGGAAHNRIGRLYRDTGLLDQAARHLGTGLALFEIAGDERGIASSLDDIGKLHWLRGDYASALEQLRLGLQMRRRLGDRRSIALSLNNVGLVLQDSGEFKQALEAFEQSLQIRREIGDVFGLIVTLNNLGTIAQDQRDDARALAMFEEALTVAREFGDKAKIALVLTNLGECYRNMGNAAEAVRHLRQAAELCEQLNDRLGHAEALRSLGMAYMQQGEAANARDCISKAVDIFAAARSRVHLGAALRTLAEITAAGGWGAENTSRAKDYLQRSIGIFEDIGNDVELARSLKCYADVLGAQPSPSEQELQQAKALHQRADEIFERLKTVSSKRPGL